MSTRKRRSHTPGPAGTAGGTTQREAETSRATPMSAWQWRTFPVFFAFAAGGFVGLYMGIFSGESSGVFVFASAFWAVLLGLGFSRFTTRWIMSRRWAQKRAAARSRGR